MAGKREIAIENLKKAREAKKAKAAGSATGKGENLPEMLLDLLETRAKKGELSDTSAAALYKALLAEMPKDGAPRLDTYEEVNAYAEKLEGSKCAAYHLLPRLKWRPCWSRSKGTSVLTAENEGAVYGISQVNLHAGILIGNFRQIVSYPVML